MVEMSASPARVRSIPRAPHRGLVERLSTWILARSERRRAEELDRIGWDLEARCEHRSAGKQRDHHVVLPPGGGLF